MLGHFDMIAIVVVLLGLVFAGVHIAIALGITAALGLYLMTGDLEVVRTFVANTAYEALRDYVFAVIPLFMLMGDFLAKCGAARDLYALGNRASQWLPGRLAAATIVANALFGFVTGVSIAAAAAFSRIAYPEMRRYRLSPRFRARLRRRQRLPWHVDTAVGADDRLVRADRIVDRQAVPRRRHPRPARRRRHDRLCRDCGEAQAGTGRRNACLATGARVRSAPMSPARRTAPSA